MLSIREGCPGHWCLWPRWWWQIKPSRVFTLRS
jgi:hypothetical protein